jgi:hypothetical protein
MKNPIPLHSPHDRSNNFSFVYKSFCKRISILCLLAGPLLLCNTVFSQSCANYTVTQTNSITYNSISSSGNSVSFWRNQTVNQNDDNRSEIIPIGFDFYYCGKKYSTISIAINGYIDFSTTVYDGNDDYWTYSGSGYQDCGGQCSYRENAGSFFTHGCGASAPNYYDGTYWALAPMYCDLWTQSGSQTVADNFKYKTSGTAPNRTFTVEYIHVAEWVAASSDYNFQVVLHETSGVIDFNYGTMNSSNGYIGVPYVCGINQQVSNTPALASEALVQQSPNTASFSSTATYSQTVPASNSQLTFTPGCSNNPSGSLTFTGVGSASMTLNWTDWATNEVVYAIYYSIDGGTTYDYMATVPAGSGAMSYTANYLYYQGTYFWKVYAVTEGCVSNALTGSQATTAGGNFISIKNGNWSDQTLWNIGTVPTNGDNVIIDDGTTVTIDGNYGASDVTVGQGTSGVLIIGNDATARTLTYNGNILVNAGGTFRTNTASAATHLMTLYGNITNNGIFDMNPGTSVCNITFVNEGNQTISGTGATTSFNTITPNMGDLISNTLDVTSSNFSAPTDFLKMTNGNGTFKFSVPTASITLNAFSAATTIPPTCALWMNSPNSTMNFLSTLCFRGNFTCSAGTVNVGDAADESLMSNGAIFTITGGTVNVAGRLTRPSYVAITNFAMSGGNLILNTIGSNDNAPASGTVAAPPFCIDVTGSSFNMTGGTIIIRNTGSGSTANWAYSNRNCSSYNFSGGTLQIGDASTSSGGQTFYILNDHSTANLVVDNTSNTKIASIYNMYSGAAAPLTVSGNVTINSGSVLIINNNDLTVAGTTYLGSAECLVINSDGSFIDNGIAGSGTARVEKSLSDGRWWYLGSPLSNGTAAAFGTLSSTPNSGNRLYYWDEPSHAYVSVTNTTDAMPALRGYSFKRYDASPITAAYTGYLNTGTIGGTTNLTYNGGTSQGFNLVCNPYPSAIDLGTAAVHPGVTATNLVPTFWFRTNNTFSTYNWTTGIGTPGSTTGVVPAMQAFWVRTNGSTGGLEITNNSRIHSGMTFYKDSDDNNIFRISVSGSGASDETVVAFFSDAAMDFDLFDSEKMFAADEDIPQLYSLTNDHAEVAINGQSELTTGTERIVSLGFQTNSAGTFTLKAINLDEFDPGTEIYLEDQLIGVFQDLRQNNSYSYTTVVTADTSRFKLHFGSIITGISSASETNVFVYTFENNIYINSPENGIVEVYNTLGEKIAQQQISTGLNKIQFNTTQGIYIVKIISGSDIITKKVFIGE